MTLTTTFRLLKAEHACEERYRYLAKAMGGVRKYGRDTPIPLTTILETNGIDDALWAFSAVPEEQSAVRDRLAPLFACWCVRQVWHLLADERSKNAVEVAERYANGQATDEELDAARDAARDAAWDAWAAWDAARDAAWAARAAWDAAWDAARSSQTAKLREMLEEVTP